MTKARTYQDDYVKLAEKLGSKIEIQENGCWRFTGYILPTGYGQMGRNKLAHRIAWFKERGSLPADGLELDHTCHTNDLSCEGRECDHRRCVNPAHLEPVTKAENVMRGRGVSPVNASKTKCLNGHEFSEENTFISVVNKRVCITCRRDMQRDHYPRHAEKTIAYVNEWRREKYPHGYAMRDWARANGFTVKDHGPLSRAVKDAYAAAGL